MSTSTRFDELRKLDGDWSQFVKDAGKLDPAAIDLAEDVYNKIVALRMPNPGVFPDSETKGVRLEWLTENSHLVLAFDGETPEDSFFSYYDEGTQDRKFVDLVNTRTTLDLLMDKFKRS